ncbi:low molecular weight protein-tyrosine-phosphatase [Brachymonas sp. G13]|uniref:low molecular weight protein-tyrosine-phosphatase n=1 Tax=Brachymonas TaxID=28219 RepID=UPI00169622FB|nr:low molecular weight protein-tyrosine-phosphatase [Brachymonas sp. J145]MEE1653838.1 low molecular weight protein-tyrosine-phosphatase [Brachymonas sp. J145]NLX15632.1 low molecular weight phosphotyrosine protein phosphatase [Ramlibacter sp.]
MFNKILVVCVGNICRSPLAEAKLRQLAPASVEVASAGIQAMVDHPADPQSQVEAVQDGLDLSSHRARQLTDAMCQSYDLILVMEQRHVDSVCQISPSARGKVMLLGRWNNQQEVADPYRKDASHFASAYQLISAFSEQWKSKMNW